MDALGRPERGQDAAEVVGQLEAAVGHRPAGAGQGQDPDQGGQRVFKNGQPQFLVKTESPACVSPLADPAAQVKELREKLGPQIEAQLLQGKTAQARARVTYLAICLDLAEPMRQKHPAAWDEGIKALTGYWNVAQVLYHHSPVPAAAALQGTRKLCSTANPCP